jgi:hypothetical protein
MSFFSWNRKKKEKEKSRFFDSSKNCFCNRSSPSATQISRFLPQKNHPSRKQKKKKKKKEKSVREAVSSP